MLSLRERLRRGHADDQGPRYFEVEGCPVHDLTYFHGDQSRHEHVTYPPCVECQRDAS